jgi:hypothetical protein
MELVEGQTLRQLIDGKSATLDKIVTVMTEVLAALGATHAIQIVHRDLKPDNVMVTASGHAKVLDFGIAKLVAGLHGDVPRTVTGQALGTPEYMAPEQVSGGTLDARTDLYAAGIVLFELVTGRRPFEARTDFELMRLQLEQAPPSARELRPDLPPALDDVIQRALEKAPERRFQTAAEMARALADAMARPARRLPVEADRAVATRSQPTVADRPGAMPKRAAVPARRAWSIVGVGLATAAGAATIAIVTHGDRTPAPIALPSSSVVADAPAAPVPTMLLAQDPSFFDLIGYLPEAQAIARTELPDAELVWFSARSVAPSGLADLAVGPTTFVFRSPTAHDASRPCEVTVALKPNAAYVLPNDRGSCDAPIGARPRCTISEARAKLALEHQRGAVTWAASRNGGRWIFGTGDDALKVDDECQPSTEAPRPPEHHAFPNRRAAATVRDAGLDAPVDAAVDAGLDASRPRPSSENLVLTPDYDERRLQIDMYRAIAMAHARELDPEARTLVRIMCEQVFPDGHADLRKGRCELDFASPTKSTQRGGDLCNTIQIVTKRADLYVKWESHDCADPIGPPPRCGIEAVWKLARAAGADPTLPAAMTYAGRWHVVVGAGTDHLFVKDFADACR